LPNNRITPFAILLHGYIGSGKSTLASSLEAKLPAIRLSIDEWIVHLYGRNPAEESFAAGHAAVKGLVLKIGLQALQAGISVVFDSGHWDAEEREECILRCKDVGALPVLISLVCNPETAWERVLQRNLGDGHQGKAAESLFIDANTFKVLREKFAALEEAVSAPYLVIDSTKASPEEVAKAARQWLGAHY
jgi:predicted kinase